MVIVVSPLVANKEYGYFIESHGPVDENDAAVVIIIIIVVVVLCVVVGGSAILICICMKIKKNNDKVLNR